MNRWLKTNIANMKARCPDLRTQGDDLSLFDQVTSDVIQFCRQGGCTDPTFLDPHLGLSNWWNGVPTIVMSCFGRTPFQGLEHISTFLHEAGHWNCWLTHRGQPCFPCRTQMGILNSAQNEQCAEEYALREHLAAKSIPMLETRMQLVYWAYRAAEMGQNHPCYFHANGAILSDQNPNSIWKQCERMAPKWKVLAKQGLANRGWPVDRFV